MTRIDTRLKIDAMVMVNNRNDNDDGDGHGDDDDNGSLQSHAIEAIIVTTEGLDILRNADVFLKMLDTVHSQLFDAIQMRMEDDNGRAKIQAKPTAAKFLEFS